MMNTLVELSAIDSTSSDASMIDVAMYFAVVPKPGQVSVIGKSLSMVLGTPIQLTGNPISSAILEILKAVSDESPPPL